MGHPLSMMAGMVFAVVLPFGAVAQMLSWRSYTVDQGLPDNEVYKVLPDSRGYLWFATNQGICRFNGYEFVRPADTSAQRGAEAFLPVEDAQGRIWFARLDGTLWFVENDTVRAWAYNHLIRPWVEKYLPMEDITITQTGTVWLALKEFGYLVVSGDGRVEPITLDGQRRRMVLFLAQVEGKMMYVNSSRADTLGEPRQAELALWENGKIKPFTNLVFPKLLHKQTGAWRLRNGDILLSQRKSIYLIRGEQVIWMRQIDFIPEKVWEAENGALWMAAHVVENVGLFYAPSIGHLQRGEYRNLLPGHFVSNIGRDREGGIWVTLLNGGVRYCKNPGIEIFDTRAGLPYSDVSALAGDGKNTIFVGTRPAHIAVLRTPDNSVSSITGPTFSAARTVYALYYDPHRQRLWSCAPLQYWDGKTWEVVAWNEYADVAKGTINAKTICADPDGKTLWTSSHTGFYRVDAATGAAERVGVKSSRVSVERTLALAPDAQGNLWVATISGLRFWRNGQYAPPPFEPPALRYRAQDIAPLASGSMAVSLRSAGVLIRDAQGRFTHLTTRDGLSTDFITRLYPSPDGTLFACSNAGLNWLTPLEDGSWRIVSIDRKDGLPSNHVNDVLVQAGEIWVATDKGITRFRDLPPPAAMPPPEMERLLVNNAPMNFLPDMRLGHNQNSLSIRFLSLHYRSEGEIPYRYRLSSGADTAFTYTHTREVNFAGLAPGAYTFEVQAQNEAGEWSDPTRWTFRIRAAWWQTSWFWSVLITVSSAGLVLWYRSRLLQERREAETSRKISELESAALRAQMNPHFIFNCLSSIQNFIAANEPDAATRYLARFARLVRLALHGSVDGTHSLREEVEMLENYLALEQLRFPGRFSFHIETDPALDPDAIALPPMLVQPFVENALLHGMSNKTEGGRIGVAFTLQGRSLLATVTDNGPGFGSAQSAKTTDPGRKSLGMMLTQRRLDILAGQRGEAAFRHENILDEAGNAAGMKVELRIPVEV